MDRKKELDNFLGEILSVEASEIESPNPALIFAARERVLARKKVETANTSFLERFLLFFKLDFKFYHVGLSLLLISAGIFYLNEPNYTSNSAGNFISYDESLSIKNTTISVNSSTMLTSIPTLVIRN
ncbi:hypothetical protein CNR22_16450 [Sphingobacteriaceae bacterium]|nr:hypothetical protein CNR22_16450 [Sphingobacteriaceae bacterium]